MKIKILAKSLWDYDELNKVCLEKGWRIPTREEIKNLYYFKDFEKIVCFTSDLVENIHYNGKLISAIEITETESRDITINSLFKLKGLVIKDN